MKIKHKFLHWLPGLAGRQRPGLVGCWLPGLAGLIFGLLAIPAHAVVPTLDPSSIGATLSSAGSIVSSIVDQNIQSLKNSMNIMKSAEDQAGKIVSAISVVNNVTQEATKHIAEAQDVAEATRSKQKATVDATVAAQPPASGGCSGRLAGKTTQTTGAQGKKFLAARGSFRAHTLNVAMTPSKQLDSVLATHKAYCSDDDKKNKVCDAPVPPKMQNADVKAEALFGGAGGADTAIGESLTFAPDQSEAAKAFIHNATDAGSEPRKLSTAEAQTTAGKEYLALQKIYASRTAIPGHQFERVLARATPTADSRAAYKRLMEDTTDSSGYFKSWVELSKDSTGVRHAGDQISELEMMRYEVDRRYANAQWHTQIQKGGTEGLLKEVALMMSVLLKFEYEHYRDREQSAILAAQQAFIAINADLAPKLEEAKHRAMSTAR